MVLSTATYAETDDVRQWTQELARDPSSEAYLPLAETLRVRGQLEPACQVATRGVARHPHNPQARDLLARIFVDRGELRAAFDEWSIVLQLAPAHVGAIKGMAFVRFQQGMLDEAERLLLLARTHGGDADTGITAAIRTVRRTGAPAGAPAAEPQPAQGMRAPRGSGGMSFRTFVSDIATAVAQHVDPNKVKVAEAVAFWAGQGYRTGSLERLLERGESEAGHEKALRHFAGVVERLRELEGRVIAADPALGRSDVFRDPEQLAAAEELSNRVFGRAAPPSQRAGDGFFLDHEKVVWHWPDLRARLTEDVR
ncbi:MAG: hypothetical protein ACRENU_01795 [Gemmatimonadaceae bacterium]